MAHGELGGRLSDDDAARISEELGRLTAAKLPLGPGLRATADEMSFGSVSSSLHALANALERGATLEEAVAAEGARLPAHLRGLILIGERTGDTAKVLGRFVAFTNIGVELRRNLLVSLAYPALAITLSLCVLTFVSTALIGSFEAIFKDFGVPLPGITIILLKMSQVLNLNWSKLFGGIIALFVFLAFTRLLLSESTRRSFFASIPVLGAVWRNSSLAECCHLLAVLLECEVPLGEALRLTGEGVRDDTLTRACMAAARDVDAGLSLASAIDRHRDFPRGLTRILRWAEGHRSLPEALRMLGEMFESRARTQASLAGTILAVVTVVSILMGVAFVVVGLFLPLITLISRLSG